jgi:hypothetical protein
MEPLLVIRVIHRRPWGGKKSCPREASGKTWRKSEAGMRGRVVYVQE